MKFTIDKDIGEPTSLINDIAKDIATIKARKIDEWLDREGVKIENARKFKIKIIGNKYELYPALGRNAKKIISSLYI